MLMAAFKVIVGNTGGGLIDFFIWGVFQPGSHWYWIVIVGPFFFIAYYLVFKTYLTKKNLSIDVADEDSEEETETAGTASIGNKQLAQAHECL